MKESEENLIRQDSQTEVGPQSQEQVGSDQSDQSEQSEQSEQSDQSDQSDNDAAAALREAYLRGRNEAIAEALGRDAEHPFDAPRNHTPGIQDPYTPPSDPALAAVFTFRQSVWQ